MPKHWSTGHGSNPENVKRQQNDCRYSSIAKWLHPGTFLGCQNMISPTHQVPIAMDSRSKKLLRRFGAQILDAAWSPPQLSTGMYQ